MPLSSYVLLSFSSYRSTPFPILGLFFKKSFYILTYKRTLYQLIHYFYCRFISVLQALYREPILLDCKYLSVSSAYIYQMLL